ncbi:MULTISPECIES: hypothetical protein [Halobacterium]|uniref:DUF7261 family protein n=1 Tax=Halobacterium TaxID=2239 RepID=UPI0018D2133A|nr:MULTISPECIES: hypothetical protein [Halobacterium]MCG1002143.1 hypothetical protein [Halobacterium noricense]
MSERGQLVLVAAAVAALALVPVAAAYLQFGYAPAVADADEDHGERVTRVLDRIADDAAETATGATWSDRERAVERVEAALAPRLRAVERSRLGDGVVVNVTYDGALARQVDCPDGQRGSFGACEVHGGVVVQERADETVVVAVAFEVRVTTPEETTRLGHVVRPQ